MMLSPAVLTNAYNPNNDKLAPYVVGKNSGYVVIATCNTNHNNAITPCTPTISSLDTIVAGPGTIITVTGSTFTQNSTCRFTNVIVSASYINSTLVRCNVPMNITLDISVPMLIDISSVDNYFNDIMYQKSILYTNVSIPIVTRVNSGIVGPGSTIEVVGSLFVTGAKCRFTSGSTIITTTSVFVNSTLVLCTLSSNATQLNSSLQVEVTNDGQWYLSSNPQSSQYLPPPSVAYVPISIPTISVTSNVIGPDLSVTIRGSMLLSGAVCRYTISGTNYYSVAQIINDTAIVCTAPSNLTAAVGANVQVAVSNDATVYTTANQPLSFVLVPLVTSILPSLVEPADDILITGLYFTNTSTCQFAIGNTQVIVAAVYINSSAIQCRTPSFNATANTTNSMSAYVTNDGLHYRSSTTLTYHELTLPPTTTATPTPTPTTTAPPTTTPEPTTTTVEPTTTATPTPTTTAPPTTTTPEPTTTVAPTTTATPTTTPEPTTTVAPTTTTPEPTTTATPTPTITVTSTPNTTPEPTSSTVAPTTTPEPTTTTATPTTTPEPTTTIAPTTTAPPTTSSPKPTTTLAPTTTATPTPTTTIPPTTTPEPTTTTVAPTITPEPTTTAVPTTTPEPTTTTATPTTTPAATTSTATPTTTSVPTTTTNAPTTALPTTSTATPTTTTATSTTTTPTTDVPTTTSLTPSQVTPTTTSVPTTTNPTTTVSPTTSTATPTTSSTTSTTAPATTSSTPTTQQPTSTTQVCYSNTIYADTNYNFSNFNANTYHTSTLPILQQFLQLVHLHHHQHQSPQLLRQLRLIHQLQH